MAKTDSTTKGKYLRRFGRILLRVAIGAMAFLLLLFLLIQLPPVQRYIVGQVEASLQERLQTEVRIGGVGLSFPKAFSVYDSYVNTPDGDTLLAFAQIDVNINMWKLLSRRVVIKSIAFDDLQLQAMATRSSSNYQFVVDAFTSVETSNTPSSTWEVRFPSTSLTIHNSDIFFQDETQGILADAKIGLLEMRMKKLDLGQRIFDVQKLSLSNTTVIGLIQSVASDGGPPQGITLSGKHIEVNTSMLDLTIDSIGVYQDIDRLRADGLEIALGTQFLMSLEDIQAQYPAFRVDVGDSRPADGFDPLHLDLQAIDLAASNLRIRDDTISAEIDAASFTQGNGPALNNFSGAFDYAPGQIELENINMQTPFSGIDVPTGALSYRMTTDGGFEAFRYSLQGEGVIGIQDILWLVPALKSNPELVKVMEQEVVFTLDSDGNQEQLDYRTLTLSMPGLELNATGVVKNIFDTDLRTIVVRKGTVRAIKQQLLPVLPAEWIPGGIELPDVLQASVSGKYSLQTIAFDISATETRKQRLSFIDSRGSISGYENPDLARISVFIDSISATHHSILAYLPAGVLPSGYRLPESLHGHGSVTGSTSDLRSAMYLAVQGDSTYVNFSGRFTDITDPDKIVLDLDVAAMDIFQGDLVAILPDSTIPADFYIPRYLTLSNASFTGPLDHLQINAPFGTPIGTGNLSGIYDPANTDLTLEVKDLDVAPWLPYSLRDSLRAFGLATVDAGGRITGVLEPDLNANFSLELHDNDGFNIATMTGRATDDLIDLNYDIDHRVLVCTGHTSLENYRSELSTTTDAQIQLLSLQGLGVSEAQQNLEMRVQLKSRGTSLQNISLNGRLDEVILSAEMPFAFVDSITINASSQDRVVGVSLLSEVFDLELDGNFDPNTIGNELTNVFESYFSEEVKLAGGQQAFSVVLQVKRTDVFTSGLIPGLTEMDPFSGYFRYNQGNTLLRGALGMTKLVYQDIEMKNAQSSLNGSKRGLELALSLEDLRYLDQFALGKTKIQGTSAGAGIALKGTVVNDRGIERHVIASQVVRNNDTLTVEFNQEQLINFQPWKMSSGNRITLAPQNLTFANWELASGGERIRLTSPASDGLEVTFDQFDINTIAKLINTEEDIASGRVNGSILLKNLFAQPGITAAVTVADLRILKSIFGTLRADIASENQRDFAVDMGLQGFGNQLFLNGQYSSAGESQLILDIRALKLKVLESFAFGYLDNTKGYLKGQVNIGGSYETPRFDGALNFEEASIAIPEFGSVYRVSNKPIRFSDKRITLQGLTLTDIENHTAEINGTVVINTIDDIVLNLDARGRDFLALNSTAADNDLYYGRLVVDSDVNITGKARLPIVRVNATPKRTSDVTYVYSDYSGSYVETTQGIIRFAEDYEWDEIISAGNERDSASIEPTGLDINVNLDINENMLVTVLLDPLTGQKFTGSAKGNLTYQEFTNGVREMTGRLELTKGKYDFVYQGVMRREFDIVPGSSLQFTGDPYNPLLDLQVRYAIEAPPFPLVSAIDPQADASGLRRSQTFYVVLNMEGNLNGSSLRTDIIYPDDVAGNQGLSEVSDALAALRSDDSRLQTTAFSLLAFRSFNFPIGGSSGFDAGTLESSAINAVLDRALGQALNNTIGFVEIDLDLQYRSDGSSNELDSRISIARSLFNDRLLISVDGIYSTERTTDGGAQSYIDNITAEYLLTERGDLKLRIFNDRDRNALVGDNVIRFGGRLVFSKDFEKLK